MATCGSHCKTDVYTYHIETLTFCIYNISEVKPLQAQTIVETKQMRTCVVPFTLYHACSPGTLPWQRRLEKKCPRV